jgi:hypothetical protein
MLIDHVLVYEGAQADLNMHVQGLSLMWHQLACGVLACDGAVVAWHNASFLVRMGSGHRNYSSQAVDVGEFAWEQLRNEFGEISQKFSGCEVAPARMLAVL